MPPRSEPTTIPSADAAGPGVTTTNRTSDFPCGVLATDLDGTFIPLPGDESAGEALAQIRKHLRTSARQPDSATLARHGEPMRFSEQTQCQSDGSFPLLFVTGRHFASVIDAIDQESLPIPDWILCDVGTSVYRRTGDGSTSRAFQRITDYDHELAEIVRGITMDEHRQSIGRLPGFRLQETFKQGLHKLSYYVDGDRIDEHHAAAQTYLSGHGLDLHLISSVDPFNGDGLIDVLPRDVSKASALRWWSRQHAMQPEQIVFCGDSGNDLAAMIDGYRCVVVANAERKLARHVWDVHRKNGWTDRLYLAERTSTAGVLDGMRWFGLLPRGTAGGEPIENQTTAPESAVPSTTTVQQRSPILGATNWGAVPIGHDQTRFRVWAPDHDIVQLERLDAAGCVIDAIAMTRSPDGFHQIVHTGTTAGDDYRYRLTDGRSFPDPASRCQPGGVHGPSRVVDPRSGLRFDLPTTNKTLRPRTREELIFYELHVGTFTDAGTFAAAIDRLDELVELGITAIELMPPAACPGRWNWGYDGVGWFAPMHALGSPDDMRRFVAQAHARGLAVIVDVVYNHFGPEGNYLAEFGPYLSPKHETPWGSAPNFDDPDAGPHVRRFVIDNALMWLDEYDVDGLRVDAIHSMADDSADHIAAQLGREVRQFALDRDRRIWLIAETNVFDSEMTASPSDGGMGFDAQWCDDFVHGVFATLRPGEQWTHRTYQPFTDLSQTLRDGFVYTGDVRGNGGRATGTPTHAVDRLSQIVCIQNHDFIGNHPLGQRLHELTDPATQAAAATLMMFSPSIPMIFMGEEFACPRPFQFFVDFSDESMRHAVVEGRKREYPQHDWSGGVSPIDPAAMTQSRIGPAASGNAAMRAHYQSLIRHRRAAIDQGLLHADNLSTDCDAAAGTFRLCYRRGAERLELRVRLNPLDQAADPLPLPADRPAALVDSLLALTGKGANEHAANHALVYRWTDT